MTLSTSAGTCSGRQPRGNDRRASSRYRGSRRNLSSEGQAVAQNCPFAFPGFAQSLPLDSTSSGRSRRAIEHWPRSQHLTAHPWVATYSVQVVPERRFLRMFERLVLMPRCRTATPPHRGTSVVGANSWPGSSEATDPHARRINRTAAIRTDPVAPWVSGMYRCCN